MTMLTVEGFEVPIVAGTAINELQHGDFSRAYSGKARSDYRATHRIINIIGSYLDTTTDAPTLRTILRSDGPVLCGGTLIGDDAYFHVRNLRWVPITGTLLQVLFEIHETDASPFTGRINTLQLWRGNRVRSGDGSLEVRTLTTPQAAALEATDRTTYVRVQLEDPDGNMVTVSEGFFGHDWLDEINISVTTDPPISEATIRLLRTADLLSLGPLMEGSLINRDAASAYAPFINPNRKVTIETATMLAGHSVDEWVLIWEGIAGRIAWGGQGNYITIRARDPMVRLARTFIESVASYGDNGGTEDVEDVMQEVLDDTYTNTDVDFGSAVAPMIFTATSFPIGVYPLGNVTVLEALQGLLDWIGWNLHWKWDDASGEFRLTLWLPDRANTTLDYTFGTDDIFTIDDISLDDDGIRNAGKVWYTNTTGSVAQVSDTRTSSVALYERRFIFIDAQDTAVTTSAQADALLAAILDDLEVPALPMRISAPFFWPAELGDLYAFSSNDHFDTEQTGAVFAYQHTLSSTQRRTVFTLSDKPSGGYTRWHEREREPKKFYNARRKTISAAEFGGDGDEFRGSAIGVSTEGAANIKLPVGSIITRVVSKGARVNSADSCVVDVVSPTSYNGSPPLPVSLKLYTLTHSVDANDWTEQGTGQIVIGPLTSKKPYSLIATVLGDADLDDGKLAWVEVYYLEPKL